MTPEYDFSFICQNLLVSPCIVNENAVPFSSYITALIFLPPQPKAKNLRE